MAGTDSWATSPRVRNRMQQQPSWNTKPELRLRKELHARGLRFRIHRRLLPGSRRTTDIAFGPSRVAVYVDGCFWHGCPEHYRPPSENPGYWHPKIANNRRRDHETDEALGSLGWLVIRAWEHDDFDAIADRVELAVLKRRPT